MEKIKKMIFNLKRTLLILLWFSLTILIVSCDNKNSTETDADDLPENPDPFEQNKRIAHSLNLGNALEAPEEGEWGVTLKQEYFKLIKEAGFNAVRIPIRWSSHAATDSPFTVDNTFFKRIDWAIINARNNHLCVIINIHHYEEIMQNPSAHKNRFLHLWRQISDRYQEEPLDLFFEILNEPNDQLTPALWNSYLVDALNVIREKNLKRTVIIGTANWGGLGNLNDLVIPASDQYIIVTYHYYNPFQFTHQGAEWVAGSEAWLGTTWTGTPAQKQAIMNDFEQASSWSAKYNRPLLMGEFGAYNKADMNSRINWTEFAAREAERRGFSWAYWEFCAGFGVYDLTQNSWRPGLLGALIPDDEK